jgi:hypothetical protein
VLIAVLALIVEAVLAGVQRAAVSPGLRPAKASPSGAKNQPPPGAAAIRSAPEMAGVNP